MISKKKDPELRKLVRLYVEKKRGDWNYICPNCGAKVINYKMIRSECSECWFKRSISVYLIPFEVSSIYTAYLNGKCKWFETFKVEESV